MTLTSGTGVAVSKEVYVTFNGNSKEWPIYKQRIKTISEEKGWKDILTT